MALPDAVFWQPGPAARVCMWERSASTSGLVTGGCGAPATLHSRPQGGCQTTADPPPPMATVTRARAVATAVATACEEAAACAWQGQLAGWQSAKAPATALATAAAEEEELSAVEVEEAVQPPPPRSSSLRARAGLLERHRVARASSTAVEGAIGGPRRDCWT